jgi:hypothetical protein
MNYRLWTGLCGGLLGVVCLLPGTPAVAETSGLPKEPEPVEVLGRGPVHEAFARPLPADDKPGPVAPKPPPEPPQEQPPAQKPEGDNVQWVPGYWQWDDVNSKFIWVTGVWREPPPKRKWIPGAYRQSESGYQWSAGYWAPESQEGLNYLPQPPATVDEGPNVAAPDDTATWVPGCWIWRDTRYVWRPGYWLSCRPGWVWQPAHYVCSPAGYLFVAGYWDYPLETRGVLFAPVCFSVCPAVWTPSVCVGIGSLPGALFVRTGCCSYFYGDYFGASFVACGFTPWLSVSIGRGGCCDPLWGYYRGYYASVNNVTYINNLRTVYANRAAGRAPRPAHSLHQQGGLKGGGHDAQSVAMLHSLSESAPQGRRLVDVNREDRDRQLHHASQLRQAATHRARSERELIARHEAPTAHSSPRHVDVQVPHSHYKGTSERIGSLHEGRHDSSPSAVRRLESSHAPQYGQHFESTHPHHNAQQLSTPRADVSHQPGGQQHFEAQHHTPQQNFQQYYRSAPSQRAKSFQYQQGGKPRKGR